MKTSTNNNTVGHYIIGNPYYSLSNHVLIFNNIIGKTLGKGTFG